MPLVSTTSVRQVPVVIATTAWRSFVSRRRASGLALADLGVAAFFAANLASTTLGTSAPWFVLAAVVVGWGLRAADLESWALLSPGGPIGRAQEAFGPRIVPIATAAQLVERLLLAAVCVVVVGDYVSALGAAAIGHWTVTRNVTPEEVSTVAAAAALGVVWIRIRLGRGSNPETASRQVWGAIGILLVLVIAGAITMARTHAAIPPLPWMKSSAMPLASAGTGVWSRVPSHLLVLVAIVIGFGQMLPVLGSGEGLSRIARDLPPPRVAGLRRIAVLIGVYALVVTALLAWTFSTLVPIGTQADWGGAPLIGLVEAVIHTAWLRGVLSTAVVVAAALLLTQATEAAVTDAESTLLRLSQQGVLSEVLRLPHLRFGTLTRLTDTAAAAVALAIIASGGRVSWLAAAYGIGAAMTIAIKLSVLVRLRARRTMPAPFRVPPIVRIFGKERSVGLWTLLTIVVGSALALVASGDAGSVAGAGTLVAVAGVIALYGHRAARAADAEPGPAELVPASDLSLSQVDARPGNVLVAVRNPHSLAHLAAALRAAGERDVVVMTVRLVGFDVADDTSDAHPTAAERALFAEVLAVAERSGRNVRLLIVPARNVFEAVTDAILRLQSSEIYVGESATLSAADQARLLGDAWERADKPERQPDVRLVIYHPSGRTDTYHLGAHPPSLSPADLDLIHRVWLDASKAVGPHVHHHDVVRAALTQMEQQLNGPDRDEALDAIRQVARPADELAAVVRSRDFARLRDMMRNRHASDLAQLLTELSLEDQVVVFRVLPRKDAAAAFEYLSQDDQEALLEGDGPGGRRRAAQRTWRPTTARCSSRNCPRRPRASC